MKNWTTQNSRQKEISYSKCQFYQNFYYFLCVCFLCFLKQQQKTRNTKKVEKFKQTSRAQAQDTLYIDIFSRTEARRRKTSYFHSIWYIFNIFIQTILFVKIDYLCCVLWWRRIYEMYNVCICILSWWCER